jgi:hypothetical protein
MKGCSTNSGCGRRVRLTLLPAVLLLASACAGSAPLAPSTPSPTPVPPIQAWSISGAVTDRTGVPVNRANVYLFLYSYGEDYSGSVQTDTNGRFTIIVTRTPGVGELITTHSGFARQVDKVVCAPPACGYDSQLSVAIQPAKVTSVALLGPGLVYVGDSAAVRREVRLDDGRVISDDGSSAILPEFGGDGTWAYDPAIARVRTGPGGVSHVFGMAVGTATLTTHLGAFRIQMPVQVSEKQ